MLFYTFSFSELLQQKIDINSDHEFNSLIKPKVHIQKN